MLALFVLRSRARLGARRLFCLLVFLMDATLRARDLQDTSADWQSLAKLGLWAGALAIGIVHLPRTHRMLLRTPAVCPRAVRAVGDDDRRLLALAGVYLRTGISFFGLVLFTPAVLTRLQPASILMVLAGTLTAFLALSWIVYGLVPGLGPTSYYTRAGDMCRMSGLAGKPTNLGAPCRDADRVPVRACYMKRIAGNGPRAGAAGARHPRRGANPHRAGRGDPRRRHHLACGAGRAGCCCLPPLSASPGTRWSCTAFRFDLEEAVGPLARSGNVKEIFTFTGRTDIWKFVIGKIAESPWLGYGYGASRIIISGGYASNGDLRPGPRTIRCCKVC